MNKRLIGLAVCSMLATLSGRALAAGTYTFPGLVWSFSTAAAQLDTCSNLVADVSGDFIYGRTFLLSGTVNCAGGSYSAYGAGYLSVAGTWNMTMNIGINRALFCQLSPATLSGTCTLSDSNANIIGPANLAFL